jgi:hypothetical protein
LRHLRVPRPPQNHGQAQSLLKQVGIVVGFGPSSSHSAIVNIAKSTR